MANRGEDTMRELDDILRESDRDAERLTAFLKLKTAARSQGRPQFVLGNGGDISFDVDVDLIKLPPKQLPKQTEPLKVTQMEPQKPQNDQSHHLVAPSQQHSENIPPLLPLHSILPGHPVSSPGNVLNSQRLRSSRDLQNETILGSFEFSPGISSTPAFSRFPHLEQQVTTDQGQQRRDTELINEMPPSSHSNHKSSPKAKLSGGATFIAPRKSTEPVQLAQSSLPKTLSRCQEPVVRLRRLSNMDLGNVATGNHVTPQLTPEQMMDLLHSPDQGAVIKQGASNAARTSTSPSSTTPAAAAAAVSCGIQTSSTAVRCQISSDLSTDDEEELERTAPLNLAANNTNIIKIRRLLKDEHSQQLLDLHCSRNQNLIKDYPNKSQKPTLAALNKPPRTPINGEQFAKELQRMSHYEILDLRKRNSIGKLIPLNGHYKSTIEQQQAVEHSIKAELLRRKLSDDLTAAPSEQMTLPPNGIENSLAKKQPLRRRKKSRDPPMTTELQNYISASRIIEERIKSGHGGNSKRTLYTKGLSDAEDVSPLKQPRLSYIQIAPAPPKRSDSIVPIESIAIVPPPPAFMRFSQCMLPDTVADSRQADVTEVPQEGQNHQTAMQVQEEEIVDVENVDVETVEAKNATKDNIEIENSNNVEIKKEEEKEDPKVINDQPIKDEVLLEELLNNIEKDEQELEDEKLEEQSNSMEKSIMTMDKPTPPMLEQMDLDDQPSTSRAARSLNKSQQKVIIAEKNRKKKHQSKPENDDDDAVFKKPKAPAPRRKKKNWVDKELKNLVITLDNEKSKQDDDETINDHDTTGVRKSKRGHVPLRNTWSHSINEPFKFTFFERSIAHYSGIPKKPNCNTSKNQRSTSRSENFSLIESNTLKRKRDELPEPERETTQTSLKSGRHNKQSNRNAQLSSDSDDEPDPEQMPLQDEVVTETKLSLSKTKRELPKRPAKTNVQPKHKSGDERGSDKVPSSKKMRGRPRGASKRTSKRYQQLSSDSDNEPEQEQMPLQDKVVTESKLPSSKAKRELPKRPAKTNVQPKHKSGDERGSDKVPSSKKMRGRPRGASKRHQQLNSDSDDEQESEQMPLQNEIVTNPKVPSPKKKRGRPKGSCKQYQQLNSDLKHDPEPEPEPELESEQTPLQDKVVAEQTPLPDKVVAEPMSLPEQTESALIEPSAVLTDGEKKLLQYTSYLRGASDESFSNDDNITSSRNESAMQISSTAHLKFKLIEGIEYSFFDTEDKLSLGYMRFPPLFERSTKKNKLKTVRLIVVYGEFDVVVELESNIQTRVLKLGEMVEIKMGVRYNIINRLSECSVIMVQLIK